MTLYHGDCLDILPTLAAESVDACVTDPPYGLKFMGKDWDHGVPGVPYWQAVSRVLKPGASLVAFGGTRTHHRLMVAIEDAGFEIRDCLMWLHGQGFPKGKSQLKPAWEPIILARKAGPLPPLNIDACRIEGIAQRPGSIRDSRHFDGHERGYRLVDPPDPHPSGRWPANIVLSHEPECIVTAQRPIISAWESYENLCDSCAERAAKSEKPATLGIRASTATRHVEPITSERERPHQLDMSRAATGCSDGTRADSTSTSSSIEKSGRTPTDLSLTGTSSTTETRTSKTTDSKTCSSCSAPITPPTTIATPLSRTLDTGSSGCAASCPVRLLDEQSGERTSGSGIKGQRSRANTYGAPTQDLTTHWQGDSGGASRFFYCAKASPSERGRFNTHPTVKPLALMRWLVRLVTPSGGVVLDPFLGSGTTALACQREGFECIGIERDEHSVEIAARRLMQPSLTLGLEVPA